MADNNGADTGLTDVHRSNHVHSETPLQLIDIPGMDISGMEQELTQVSRQELALQDPALPSRMSTTPHNHSFQPLAPPTGVMSTPPIPHENNVTAPQRGPKKPVTTLVSMLPKTTYNETDEAEDTVRSLAYIRIQLQLLQWLGLHASDTLTVRQAYYWTENIAEDKHPQAKDALRLCYYMRSQGFDTYAKFQKSRMSLYIASQPTEVTSPKSDRLYWCQDHLTNEVAHELRTVPVSSGARGGRRNAFSSDLTQQIQRLQATVDAVIAAGTDIARAQSRNTLAAAAGQDEHGEDTGDNAGTVSEGNAGRENENGQPTMGSLAARIAVARADLQTLLFSDSPDTE